ncbi:MAG: type-F conjugative transfer system pilin assembly protein TrbC [Gammaproteobacteria bacterium]|nr:type-F conjugative transfer system pilin assembly protein TrbC [Gammaproteobacteria bacterium]MCW5583542.1 type-F conjugative transfer system pilin assembly protein TrbC [Gammaproteobacteria bacterium]
MNIKKLLVCLSLILVSPCYANQMLDKNIIIFVSFSMPDESLKGWMREAKIIDAPVVVRGFINNSFKDTINKISVLTKDNQGGVQVDPTLFQRFQIVKVPAVVVVKEPNCLPGMSCTLDYDIVYGDVTLSYALKKIANEEDRVSVIAKKSLALFNEAKI